MISRHVNSREVVLAASCCKALCLTPESVPITQKSSRRNPQIVFVHRKLGLRRENKPVACTDPTGPSILQVGSSVFSSRGRLLEPSRWEAAAKDLSL